MKLFGDDDGPTFKTRIRVGGLLMHDMRCGHWPWCLAPMSDGGGDVAKDPNIEFVGRDRGDYYDLVAPGFGAKGNYGNGSIFVTSIDDLEMELDQREIAIRKRRDRQLKKIADVDAEAAKLRTELRSLA